MQHDEDWHYALPRCVYRDGPSLSIVPESEVEITEAFGIAVTDGERTAVYVPVEVVKEGKPSGSSSIALAYIEAGRFCEANVLTIWDGERKALYEPVRLVPTPSKIRSKASFQPRPRAEWFRARRERKPPGRPSKTKSAASTSRPSLAS